MILQASDNIKIFRKSDQGVMARDIAKINITNNIIPETLCIESYRTQKMNPSGNLLDKGIDIIKYNIQLDGFIISSSNFDVINVLFDIFVDDFINKQHKTLHELAPQLEL